MKENTTAHPRQTARRRLVVLVLGLSVAIHAALGLLAGVWVIVRHFQTTEPPPSTTKIIAQKKATVVERQQAMQAAAFESSPSKSELPNYLQSTRASTVSLPPLPKFPNPAARMPTASFQNQTLSGVALATASGFGGGTAGGANGNGGSAVSFLGVQTNAKRIVLMFDISKTVATAAAKAGLPMERIREETARLVAGLGMNTRFGIVEFARNYAFFRPELVPNTSANRAAANDWLFKHFGTEGTLPRGVPNLVSGSPGFLVALEAVFKLQPDSIFIISDGSMQRGTSANDTIPLTEIEQALGRLQGAQATRAKVFFIGVGVQAANEKALRKIFTTTGSGSYTELRP